MPNETCEAICQALSAENKHPIPVADERSLVAIANLEMPAGQSGIFCVIRNPATLKDSSRKWGFVVENNAALLEEISSVMKITPGCYCSLEMWFTKKERKARAAVKPAPVFHLREGYISPKDGSFPAADVIDD